MLDELNIIERRYKEDTVLLKFIGNLKNKSVSVMKNKVAGYFEKGKNIVIDGANLNFIDSSGLAALLIAHNQAGEKGLKLFIVNVQELVMTTILFTKLDEILNIFKDIEELEEKLG